MCELGFDIFYFKLSWSQVARKAKRAEIFKRAEKFAKEYQDQERDEIRCVNIANKIGIILKR